MGTTNLEIVIEVSDEARQALKDVQDALLRLQKVTGSRGSYSLRYETKLDSSLYGDVREEGC